MGIWAADKNCIKAAWDKTAQTMIIGNSLYGLAGQKGLLQCTGRSPAEYSFYHWKEGQEWERDCGW